MAAVFISYRREDAAASAGRLYDRLAERFGADQVFMDVDTLAPGQDFAREIDRRLAVCAVLLAVIGPRWLEAAPGATPRLLDPADFVRREIAAALARGVTVIPVLVNGATMPARDALPEDLADLARLQAVELTHRRFHRDAQDLLAALERAVGEAAQAPRFDGEWEAEVRYDWGVQVTERFRFTVEDGEVFGTASFLGVPRGIQDGRAAGDRISFASTWEEVVGDVRRRVTNRYRGRIEGDRLRLRLQDDRGYAPAAFQARRVTAS